MSPDPWTWIAAILTLAIFSFLYGDNPLYRFAEHLLVGVSAGYYIAIYWHNNVYRFIISPIIHKHQYIYIIPLILGVLYFSILFKKYSYLIRYPIGFLLGVGAGLSIPLSFKARIVEQTKDTVLPQVTFDLQFLNAFLIFFGVLTILVYFFFSREHKGIFKPASRIGIIFLMVGFGASFGYTIMARISLLIGRFYFLLKDWLGVLQ